MAADPRPIRFGVFEVDPRSGELRKQGVKIRLPEQPLSVLVALLDQPGEVVTREDLRKRLWPADTFVDFDQGLNKAINRVRDVLGDSAESPRFIETLPKRGYRFIGSVTRPEAVVEPPGPSTAPEPADPPGPAGPARLRGRRSRSIAAALALLIGLTLPAVWWLGSTRTAPHVADAVVRSSILPPPGTAFVPYSIALSADGSHLTFAAETADGARSLWIRALASTTAHRLAGTDGASLPFWSPDDRSVGFFADRQLKVVDVAGGAVRVLADARRPSGGSWNASNVIVFAPDVNGPLYRVAATGGPVAPVTRLDDPAGNVQGHRWPVFLPDGHHFLHVALAGGAGAREDDLEIRLGSIDGGTSVPVPSLQARSIAAARGAVFAARDGVLRAYVIDTVGGKAGAPVVVPGADVAAPPTFYPSAFTVSDTGVLVFQSAADRTSELMWISAAGRELGPLDALHYGSPTFSPDGTRLAGACDGPRGGTIAICVYDVARGVGARITAGPSDRYPTWSPDGREIAYASGTGIVRIAADGSGAPQPVSTRGIPTDWTRDGQILSFGSHAGIVSLAVSSVTTHAVSELAPGAEGRLSSDGRWLAFIAPEGLVAVRYPGFAPRVHLAPYGAAQPRWSRDGRRLFFIAPDRKLMAVDFDAVAATASAPRLVAQTRIVGTALTMFQYDVAPDGRILVNAMPHDPAPLTVLTGWTSILN